MEPEKRTVTEEAKIVLSILGYIFIVYPVRRFIYPVLNFIQENTYMFACLGMFYLVLYLYDFNLSKLASDFVEKLIRQDSELLLTLLVYPFVTVFGHEINGLEVILWFMTAFLLFKLYQMFKIVGNQIKRIFGDVLLVALWIYYTITGEKEESVMLITRDEAKIKLQMYAVLLIVAIIVILIVAIPKLLMAPMVHTADPMIVNSTSIDLNMLQWVLP